MIGAHFAQSPDGPLFVHRWQPVDVSRSDYFAELAREALQWQELWHPQSPSAHRLIWRVNPNNQSLSRS
jgi:hypothetical protein